MDGPWTQYQSPEQASAPVAKKPWEMYGGTSDIFTEAKRQYPILNNPDINYKFTPRSDGPMLEAWPPGETGTPDQPRPTDFPAQRYGIEVYNPKTRPIDIMGDVASHFLVNTDPTIKGYYSRFSASITADQEARLKEQYQYSREHEGEQRSYPQWREHSGLPAYFRGYPFQQWPKEFNDKAYTPAQKTMLDDMMKYLHSNPTSAEKRMPEPAQPEGGFLDRLWNGISGKDVSRAGRVGMGLADPFYGAAQLGARMGSEEGGAAFTNPADLAARQKTVDMAVQQRQQQYTANRQAANPGQKLGTDWYRLLGNIGGSAPLSPIPAGVGAGLGTRLALGGAAGALGGSQAPVTNPQNFLRQKLGQTALGGAAGTGLGGASQAVGGAIAPRLAPDIAALRNANVPLTAGRVMGGPAQSFEQRLAGLPIIGDFINNRERQSLEGFNRTTINQALEPIGASLPAKSSWGRESLKNMYGAIDKAYDTALDPIDKIIGDADFGRSLAQLKTTAQKKPDVWSRFEPVWQEAVDNFADSKTMTGRGVKQAISELGRDVRNYSRSDDYDKRELAARLNDLKGLYSSLVQRQWPEEAPKIAAADKSNAMAMRIGQAANRRAGSEGKFTPMDLLTASRSQSGGMRGKEFQQGDALFQQWGELANRILPSSIPDSGTAGRFIAAHPITGTALGLGNLAGYVPMHLAGKAALRRSGTLPDPYRNALDQLSGITTPGFGTGVAR